MLSSANHETRAPSRVAVIDLGSNTFRLVVFSYVPGRWWKRTDEIYDAVRIGEGLDRTGALLPEPMERALSTLELYAHFCTASGVEHVRAVATSAIRDATNQADFLAECRRRTGVEVEVLSGEAEARFGYLAAVNSSAIEDGVVLDLGGGSMQLTHVVGRRGRSLDSWPFGAVRMTERFLPDKRPSAAQIGALRDHVRSAVLAQAPHLQDIGARGGRLVGIGGTVRNLASAAQLAAHLPSYGVQGFELTREALDRLVDRLATMTPGERGKVPGIKSERGDVILAGALVVQTVMELGGLEVLEATEAGLREGVLFSELLADRDPPLLEDVRADSVRNLVEQYGGDVQHVEHVAALAGSMWDGLRAIGAHSGDPDERRLLWAAAMLHDIGLAVDYDDHHKHSRYIVLSTGLPGFTARETALVGQAVRFHRKGKPALAEAAPLCRPHDEALLTRASALLRLAEQLERAKDQAVRDVHVEEDGDAIVLRLVGGGDATLARWAAQRETALFSRAFGRPVRIEVQG